MFGVSLNIPCLVVERVKKPKPIIPNVIYPPVIAQTSARGANPMTVSADFASSSVQLWDDGLSQDGTYDFLQFRRQDGNTGYFRLTPLLFNTLSDPTEAAKLPSLVPDVFRNMPSGNTRVDARLLRGPVPNRIVNMGDSITKWADNWIDKYQEANPNYEVLKNASQGRTLSDTPDGNDLESHINEVAFLAPEIGVTFIGANDLQNYNTAQEYFTKLSAFWADLRKRVPGIRIAACTVLPQGTALSGNPAKHNSLRNQLNPMIRSAVGTLIDKVIDWDLIPQVGATDAAANNTQYYPDYLHPSYDAFALMLPVYKAAIDALLTLPMNWKEGAWSNAITDTLGTAAQVVESTFDPSAKSVYALLSSDKLSIYPDPNNFSAAPAGSAATIAISSGDKYVEFTLQNSSDTLVGLCNSAYDPINTHKLSFPSAGTYVGFREGRYMSFPGAVDEEIGGAIVAVGSKIGFRSRFSDRKVLFYVDGTLRGTYPMPSGNLRYFAAPAGNGHRATVNPGPTFTSAPSGVTMYG